MAPKHCNAAFQLTFIIKGELEHMGYVDAYSSFVPTNFYFGELW
jgi:hypothetical protein